MPRLTPYSREERIASFWMRIDQSGGPDACWPWMGDRDFGGYGRIYVGVKDGSYKRARAHRFMWEVVNGSIPDGMVVCHTCDNRLCCNPSHLFVGTQRDNVQDMHRKGRNVRATHSAASREKMSITRRGELNGAAILTDAQAIEIRQSYAAGAITEVQLSQAYGVSRSAIRKVIRGETFKHLLGGKAIYDAEAQLKAEAQARETTREVA